MVPIERSALGLLLGEQKAQVTQVDPTTFRHGLAVIEAAEIYAALWSASKPDELWLEATNYLDDCQLGQPTSRPFSVLYEIAFVVLCATRAISSGDAARFDEVFALVNDLLHSIKPGAGSHATVLTYAANLWLERFKLQRDVLYLERAIEAAEGVLSTSRARHKDSDFATHILTSALQVRAELTGNEHDIRLAIAIADAGQEKVRTTVGRIILLQDLASALRWCFDQFGGTLEDLNRMVDAYREVLAQASSSDRSHAVLTNNLGNAIFTRYRSLKRIEDLNESIQLSRQALVVANACTPHDVANFCRNLGLSLLESAKVRKAMEPLDEALEYFERGLSIGKIPDDQTAALQFGKATALLMRNAVSPTPKLLDGGIHAASTAISLMLDREIEESPEYRLARQSSATSCLKRLLAALLRRGTQEDITHAIAVGEAAKSILLVRARLWHEAPASLNSSLISQERTIIGKIAALDSVDLIRSRQEEDSWQRTRRMHLRRELWSELRATWDQIAAIGAEGEALVEERKDAIQAVMRRIRDIPHDVLALSVVEVEEARDDFDWHSDVCILSFGGTRQSPALLGRWPLSLVESVQTTFRAEVLEGGDPLPEDEQWWTPLSGLPDLSSDGSFDIALSPLPRLASIPWMLILERCGWVGFSARQSGMLMVPSLALLRTEGGPDQWDPFLNMHYAVDQLDFGDDLLVAVHGSGPSVVIGNPTGDLPQATKEACRIAEILETSPIVSDLATQVAVRSGLGSAEIVHIAAHVSTKEEDPLGSQIALADGKLSARVLTRGIRRARLVVLSACQSGAEATALGGELLGLVSALIRSGVETVVASLWPVDDQATGYLMSQFYEKLRDGASVPKALSQAMADTRGQPGWEGSYFWGAFVTFGRDPKFTVQIPPQK